MKKVIKDKKKIATVVIAVVIILIVVLLVFKSPSINLPGKEKDSKSESIDTPESYKNSQNTKSQVENIFGVSSGGGSGGGSGEGGGESGGGGGSEDEPSSLESEDIENTAPSCNDNTDNDDDGLIDGVDPGCRGIPCGNDVVWIWSYYEGLEEITDSAPQHNANEYRVACCREDQCAQNDGECTNLNQGWVSNSVLCKDNNNYEYCGWDRLNEISESGNKICVEDLTINTAAWFDYVEENTRELCNDNTDNDRDSLTDWLDNNCKFSICNDEDYLVIWSHIIGEDQNTAPPADSGGRRRIQCCQDVYDCVTIEGQCIGSGERPNSHQNNVCVTFGDWQVCNSSSVGQTSYNGGWTCTYSSSTKTYQWTKPGAK